MNQRFVFAYIAIIFSVIIGVVIARHFALPVLLNNFPTLPMEKRERYPFDFQRF